MPKPTGPKPGLTIEQQTIGRFVAIGAAASLVYHHGAMAVIVVSRADGRPRARGLGKTKAVDGSTFAEIAEGAGFVAVVVTGWMLGGKDVVARWRGERRARRRSDQAELEAVDAALDDSVFEPENLRAAVREIVSLAWADHQGRARFGLGARSDRVAIEHWGRDHQVSDRVLAEAPRVDLIRVLRRAEETDRAVVRVRLTLRTRFGRIDEQRVDERWTLAHDGSGWRLVEVDASPLAGELLRSPSITHPWSDIERLNEQGLAELATDVSASAPNRVAGLVDPAQDAMHQLLDLAVADARFLPALVEAELLHLIDSWEQATEGLTQPLSKRVSATAREQLLYPRDAGVRRQLMLRDARLRRWTPSQLCATREPVRLQIALLVSAVRYVVDDVTGEHVWGSQENPRPIKLVWTLELARSPTTLWRLTGTTNPAEDIPGVTP